MPRLLPLNPLLLAILPVLASSNSCFNACSQHGTCDVYSKCNCHTGFMGADCSQRICPFGTAFSDFATADDTAHAEEECSGRGACDRTSGQCVCMEGFNGNACQRTVCNGACNGRGECLSMKDLASRFRDENSNQYVYEDVWDAEKIYGCKCDEGFSGYDCSVFDCPDGDDPMTTGQVNEVQLLKCSADPAPSDSSLIGTFALYYKGKPSATVRADATAADLELALEAISGIGDLTVSFSSLGTTVCQTSVTNVISITFNEEFGSLSPLVAYESDLYPVGSTITIAADGSSTMTDTIGNTFYSVKGTKEAGSCANRGTCDTSTGSCQCYNDNGDTFQSSDGQGNAGTRGDCGFAATSISACPGETPCSGHGTCDSSTFTCSCSLGWTGGNCGERLCDVGPAWFQYPTGNNIAHDTLVECSNMGACDRATGLCTCSPGFYGKACQFMACGGGVSSPCSGHGTCLSMRHLSWNSNDNGDATDFVYGTDPNNAATWDADSIFGCQCDEGWEGYDCALRKCVIADDPGTYDDQPEKQLIKCLASEGTFKLQFRQEITDSLDWDIPAWKLKQELEKLDTVSSVSVDYSIGNIITSTTNMSYVPLTNCQTKMISTERCLALAEGTEVNSITGGTTLLDCAEKCDQDSSCNSFSHNILTSSCSLRDKVANSTTDSAIDTTGAWQTYYGTSDPLLIKGTNVKGLCTNSTQENVAVITFASPSGDLPNIKIYSNNLYLTDRIAANNAGTFTIATDGVSIGSYTSVVGTTDESYCSGRGLCDHELGECTCASGWGSSDGHGGMGGLNDCGYRWPEYAHAMEAVA